MIRLKNPDPSVFADFVASAGRNTMKPSELKSMSTEELWALHELVAEALTAKISAEKRDLEKRLRQISIQAGETSVTGRERRPYRHVLPKYRNPAPPHETWSGRGKKPLWMTKQLRSGKKMEDFLISQEEPPDA